jgi:hypothetical protein
MGALGRRRVEASLSWEISRNNLLAACEDLLVSPLRRRRDGRHGQRVREPVALQPIAAGAGNSSAA